MLTCTRLKHIRINFVCKMPSKKRCNCSDVFHEWFILGKDLKAKAVIARISMEVSCPSCGNPNLDVDEQNSVVYCRKCGFAVRVDPQSGNVTPLNQPAAGGGPMPAAPAAYGEKTILGTDPLTFFLAATAVLLIMPLFGWMTWSFFIILESLVLIYWWYNR